MSAQCAVLDVGKTHVKLHVIDEQLTSRFSRGRDNPVIEAGLYPHYDIDDLWCWICKALTEAAAHFDINVIAVTTHGAAAALVHPKVGESGLVLPIMDYEFTDVACDSDYQAIRPPFTETYSPALPLGLNLGRQLFWQQRHCQQAFDNAQYILPYPQYWAWRLTRVAVAEVSSWGCHTDLWQPTTGDYSAVVDSLGIRAKLPPLVHAGDVIGTVTAEVSAQTGLPTKCQVIAGLHDSNASYLRYLHRKTPFTVVSTGTWVISFSTATEMSSLVEQQDMLANVDINGHPVACARFMGGREFEQICRQTGSNPQGGFTEADLHQLIEKPVFALPDFSGGSGPFGGRDPECQAGARNGTALASLYCALMLDYELELLQAQGDIIVEGVWLRDVLQCRLLAQLRPGQPVLLSRDETGTVTGAARLALNVGRRRQELVAVEPTHIRGLDRYRSDWRANLAEK